MLRHKTDFTMCDDIKLRLFPNAYLKVLKVSDISLNYIEGLNNLQVNRFLIGPKKSIQTLKTVSHFVEKNFKAHDAILFGFFVDEHLSGTLRLHDITKSSAFLGLAIFDINQWNKGWARQMIEIVSEFAFGKLGLKSIKAGIDVENIASQKAFAYAGFKLQEKNNTASDKKTGQLWELTCESYK